MHYQPSRSDMDLLHQELRRQFKGIRFLPHVSEKFYPGKIVHAEKDQASFHIRDYLRSMPAEKWHLDKMTSYNLIYGKKITGRVSLRFPASVLGVLTMNAEDSSEPAEIEYELSEIFATEFAHTSELELRFELNKLRYINKALFRQLRGQLLITESYYARSFVLSVKKSRSSRQPIFLEGSIQTDPIVQYIVNNGESLTVVSNENFPFAVKGIPIR